MILEALEGRKTRLYGGDVVTQQLERQGGIQGVPEGFSESQEVGELGVFGVLVHFSKGSRVLKYKFSIFS